MGATPLTLRVYHLVGFQFRDLRTGKPYEFYFSNYIKLRDYTEYYIQVDLYNYITEVVPV